MFRAPCAADGNPHGWDRRRRCDHTDYDPPCGVCEGYGGIPSGDANDEIELTTCTPVANASSIDPSTLIKPVWANRWTARNYTEILIGKKTDPFCFNAFPGSNSTGPLCYRKDHGTQSYDMEKARAYRLDAAVETVVGTLQSTVLHQGPNMWIINKFPWYAAGVHQCICTQPREGGDARNAPVYPIQYNWTQQMFYVGREKLVVEYINAELVLDHWAFGPHHVWSEPATGKALRMWQPFNGLQVFPNGTGYSDVDESLFEEIPPALCKKGGATFRIKCGDDGYPAAPAAPAARPTALLPTATTQPSHHSDGRIPASELARAKTKVPRGHYKGANFTHMSHVLNGWLAESKHVASVRPCRLWTAREIQQLQATLFLAREATLDDIYQGTADNRRMRLALDDMSSSWEKLNALVEEDLGHRPAAHAILRDGHCHEAVMWYVHHLTDDIKQVFKSANVEIPLLSLAPHVCPPPGLPKDEASKFASVCQAYQEKVTCASCHANVNPSRNGQP